MLDFDGITKKWQKQWEKAGIFEVKKNPKRKKYYVLEMYPYPSGSGLHMGHARNYCIGDAFARFKRMNGFNVLYPMGYDSFGLPAENAAILAKSHPKIFTEKAIATFIQQQKGLGLSYDWSRMFASHMPEYYRWDQWIFLKMYEKGLVYRKKSVVNWCPKCSTVLANEQVHNGKCWRHEDTPVEVKDLEQWFLKITDYAEELLKGIDTLAGWPEDVKTMQRNWIGRSEGAEIRFPIENSEKILTVFTTRPDTFFGITFLVYAPEHPDVMELVKGTKYEKPVREFIRKVVVEDRFARTAEDKEKEGMFIGKYALNPVTKEKIPIYIANFVLYEYGTGAIIAVPAHDERDFQFAKKYKIPIKVVINPPDYELNPEKMSRSYMGDGIMVNSGEFDGTNNRDALPEFIRFFEKNSFGKGTVQYKLRDWLISRQRFWGCPIPMVYCSTCGIVPVPEKDLPVKLPDDFKFTAGEGNPLEHCKEFVNAKCPKCSGKAKRETDTMDTFVDSSWYFLRYCDPKNTKLPFDASEANYWMPIDTYIGGKEHATMHLIYFRFFTKFLRDLGLLKADEPAPRLFNQGMLHKGGVVMSKSKGNVVVPEEIAKTYGIDTARLFLLFVASPDKDMEWSDKGIEGSFRFLKKFHSLISEKKIVKKAGKEEESKLNKTVKEVTGYFEDMLFNKAIICLMQFANWFNNRDSMSQESAEKLVLLMGPFTPHLCEEFWEKLGNKAFCSLQKWPAYDEKKIDARLEAAEETIHTVMTDISSVLKLIKVDKPKAIKLIVSPGWKYTFMQLLKKEMETTKDIRLLIAACTKNSELKPHGQDISKLIPILVKDFKKMPETILTQDEESRSLENAKKFFEEEFKCAVEIEKAEASKEAKAKQASPGKPAILIR
ncbi:leucine--tRNA ligase [Candidatus Woesearchaeota archaeon]|nr:leucine--tRNA ligase [Candidatus Woesearchaeota archaeon]